MSATDTIIIEAKRETGRLDRNRKAVRIWLGFVLFTFSGLLSLYHAYLFVNGFWAG